MKKYIIWVIFLLVFNKSQAQILAGDSFFSAGYNIGMPLGDLRNFTNSEPYNGFQMDIRYYIKPTFTMGVTAGWQSFQQRFERAVYPIADGAISSVQTRYFYNVPITITGFYNFPTQTKFFKPYIGGGLGANLINYDKWNGVFPDNRFSLGFQVRPTVGFLLPIGETFGLNISARYNYSPFRHNEFQNLQYFDISIGIFALNFN